MPVIVDWLKKRKDKARSSDARKSNTESQNRLLDLAEERFHVAHTHKTGADNRNLHDRWREIDRVYRGIQWKGAIPDGKSTPVLNFTFGLVESIIPRLTDNTPEILVFPRQSANDTILAKQLTQQQAYLWYINRMQKQIAEATRICMKYGTVLLEALWDPEFHDGILGDVRYGVVHPMNFFIDPRAADVRDADYCFTSIPKPLEYFARRWPDKGHLVAADNDWADTEGTEGSEQSSQEEVASLKAYWHRDAVGNVSVMYYAGSIVLDVIGGEEDRRTGKESEPVYRHNRFPFSRFVDYPIDKQFWGAGEVEIVLLLQRLINSFEAQIIDNTRLMANAEWVVNKVLSGLKEEDAWVFDNRPGNVIWTMQGGVEKVQGVAIPPHIPQHMERLITAMEQILGVNDVTQGRRPVGVRSASGIIALQESANVRVRLKARHMEWALQEAADQANWLMLEHYDEPRTIRLTGQAEPTTLNIKESLTRRMIDQAAAAGMMQMQQQGQPVDPAMLEQIFRELKYPDFDVEVKVGPSVPYSQALLYEQAKEFYQLGLIDRQAALEVTNFPGRESILARMEAQQAAATDQGGGERIGERTFGGGAAGGGVQAGA